MTNKRLALEDYKSILSIIHKSYNEYCLDWMNQLDKNLLINLKKKYVSDIYDINTGLDEHFEFLLNIYTENLFMYQLKVLDDINNKFNIDIRTRLKTPDSMIDKLFRNCNNHTEKFPINKILNDLLGFRIIDNNYDNNISKHFY